MTDHNQNRRPVRQSFTHLDRITVGSAVGVVNIDPVNNSTFYGVEVANMAHLYQEFRLVRLKVTMYPTLIASDASTDQTSFIMGHANMACSVAPSTAVEVSHLSDVAMITSGMSVPTHFVLNRKQLLGNAALKWYHVDTSPDVVTDMQGRIYLCGFGTHAATWVLALLVESVWEFKSPVSFGQFLTRFNSLRAQAEDHKDDASDSTVVVSPASPPPGLLPHSSQLEAVFSPAELLRLKNVIMGSKMA